MLECIPIKIDEYNANLPPPTYASMPYPRGGGRGSPIPQGQMPPPGRDMRGQNEGMYGSLPATRGGEITSQVVRYNTGRYPEDTYYGAVPPSRGGRTSPSSLRSPTGVALGNTLWCFPMTEMRLRRTSTLTSLVIL